MLEFLYQDGNLTFYVVLAVISFCFIVLIGLSMMKKKNVNNSNKIVEEEVLELPRVRENIEVLDSDTFIKRLEDLKNK